MKPPISHGYETSPVTTRGETERNLEIVENFMKLFKAEMRLRDPEGKQLAGVEDTRKLARDTADRVLDSAKAWKEHLGPVYGVEEVRSILARRGKDISRQAVSKRKSLLGLTTGSGRVVYPAFQFHEGAVVSGLLKVMKEIPEDLLSRWTLASWLVSPEPALDYAKPIEVLREGHASPVIQVARTWAKALRA